MDDGRVRRLDLQEQFASRLPQANEFAFLNLMTVAGQLTVSQRAMPQAPDILGELGDFLNQHVAVAKQHDKALHWREEQWSEDYTGSAIKNHAPTNSKHELARAKSPKTGLPAVVGGAGDV